MTLWAVLCLFGCVESDTSSDGSTGYNGVAGSTARFLVQKGHLVVVEDSRIRTFSLAEPMMPTLVDQSFTTGPRLETVFPYGEDLVLIGTNQGAVVVRISLDGLIEGLSFASHFTSRDPVVAANGIMYVTIRPEENQVGIIDNSGVLVNRGSNRLIVFDINDIENPIELIQKPIEAPSGLSISGDRLYVCFAEGLRLYNVAIPADPQVVSEYADFPCNDVIAQGSELLATGKDGIQLLENQQDVITLLTSIRVGD